MECRPTPVQLRPSAPVPYHLNERINIVLEECLYTQTAELLNSILPVGISDPVQRPTQVPAPPVLRLLSTLIVHPYYTTQHRRDVSDASVPTTVYIYLRRLISLVGPLNANLEEAWRFNRGGRTDRERRRYQREKDASPNDDRQLSGPLANEENVFALAEDMWGIVGWAFTCSVAHPKRWVYWKNFLECLLLAFEVDLGHRTILYNESHADPNPTKGKRIEPDVLEESLIMKMLPDTRGSAGYRRVIRAMFANGTGKTHEFKQIWPDELLTRRPKMKGKRAMDSLFGEHGSDEDEKEPSKRTIDDPDEVAPGEDVEMKDASHANPSTVDEWGGVEAIELRQRLLNILVLVCWKQRWIDLSDLYQEYRDTLHMFPFASFKLFICTLDMDITYQSPLVLFILESIISTQSPRSASCSSQLTQKLLEYRFFPYPANTKSLVENAKVAVLLELLTRMLLRRGSLIYSQSLEDAVEEGINARKGKVGTKGPSGRSKENLKEVRTQWENTEERLRALVRVVKGRPASPAYLGG